MPSVPIDPPLRARRLVLQGRVQGLGVRPAIARLAADLSLAGSVCNSAQGVLVEIEGTGAAVQAFVERLGDSLPPGAVVDRCQQTDDSPSGRVGFMIAHSRDSGPRATPVPVDLAACPQCLAEVQDPHDRRADYPLTTCTACGPRYSIIEAMPYDRQGTTMAVFQPCGPCDQEYACPQDRRFHSQTNACPNCGPRLCLITSDGRLEARDAEAIQRAVQWLQRGLIVGLRGIGGYQWLVDAQNIEAVRRLRALKARPSKPLAVMVADLESAAALLPTAARQPDQRSPGPGSEASQPATTTVSQPHQWLLAPANPIVILPRRQGLPWASEVCGPVETIGVMLPATPLHATLARRLAHPVVVTSGNLEGDPIQYKRLARCDAAAQAVQPGAEVDSVPSCQGPDAWLEHDRRIARPIDDSVVRVIGGRAAGIRLGRGLAPLQLDIPAEMLRAAKPRGPLLAVGGHQKVALAAFNGAQAVLGPHLGDLGTLAARRRFTEQVTALCDLYQMRPGLLVHDRHPDYFSTRWAAEQRLATLAVQHHHAHIVATMIEHGWLDRQVLGVAWDGTGYGDDGTIWGGEFLLSTATGFRRVGHLLPFWLVGGERAVRQPWRVAVSLVQRSLGAEAAAGLVFDGVAPAMVQQMVAQLDRPAGRASAAMMTSSVGRLCDGVAALVLGIAENRHDGQAAMLWEAAGRGEVCKPYAMPLIAGPVWQLDWRPMIAAILGDLASGVSATVISDRFHQGLAGAILDFSRRFADLPLLLAGGCFQNRLLVEYLVQRDQGSDRPLGTPGLIPVSDGGLAAGQLAVAIARAGATQLPPGS